MPTQRRHGLTTLLLTGDPDVRGALTAHLLAGRKTVVVQPATELDHEPPQRAGDRVLLVDGAGRSIAVADVLSTDLTTLAGVDAATRRADDPDHTSAAQWADAQVDRWRTAGLLTTSDVASVVVAVVHVRVVGLDTTVSQTEGTPR